jgi:GWxTD domain-containing protein
VSVLSSRVGGALSLLVLLLTLSACRSAAVRPGPAAAWAEGPVRWLLQPDELRRFRRLEDGRDAVRFIEQFWRRRDPDPSTPGNPFLELFHERVQAADDLYSEKGVRGSLTDRGRALVLLGPPPILRYGHQPVTQGRNPDGFLPAASGRLATETWEYPPDSLPPGLADLLQAEGADPYVVLRFVESPRRTRLVTDDRVLVLAGGLGYY